MTELAQSIVLSEVDVEIGLLGAVLMSAPLFAAVADDIKPDWFSDPFLRYLFEAGHKLHAEGHALSPKAIVACLPEDCAGIPRAQFYARVCASGVTPNHVSGLIHTLKDRWARRRIIDSADDIKSRAVLFGEDPFAIASEAVADFDMVSASKARFRGGSLAESVASLQASHADPDNLRGVTTGLRALDKKLNGYKAGQLYVIAGRPGMGKSAYMCSSLWRTAGTGAGVAIFSLEMTDQEVAARCLSDALDSVNAPAFGEILRGQLSDDERTKLNEIGEMFGDLPLHVDASPRLNFSEIKGRASRVKAELEAQGKRLAVVCIDHMGLVTPSDRYRGNKVAEAGEVSGQARELAKELDCCVVLLCQLSREVEKRDDKRPILSDLRWSGEIEQDAHVIGFLYREAYYLSQDADADPGRIAAARYRLDFLIRKNRNGETGDVPLWCSIGHSSIRDLDP